MSEQKSSFMTELEQWAEIHIIRPLLLASASGAQEIEATRAAIYRNIKGKVLESYRNGQAAGPRKIYPPKPGNK